MAVSPGETVDTNLCRQRSLLYERRDVDIPAARSKEQEAVAQSWSRCSVAVQLVWRQYRQWQHCSVMFGRKPRVRVETRELLASHDQMETSFNGKTADNGKYSTALSRSRSNSCLCIMGQIGNSCINALIVLYY